MYKLDIKNGPQNNAITSTPNEPNCKKYTKMPKLRRMGKEKNNGFK